MIYKKLYKKRFILIVAQLVLSLSVFGQSFNWVQRVGGIGNEGISKTCMDLTGNLYVAFSGGAPNIYFNSDTLQVSGLNDLFVLKYDDSGNEVWKLKIGGPNNSWIPAYSEAITDMIFDSVSNSIYLSGIYYSSCAIDTITLNSSGLEHGFLTKIDVNGNVLWAKNFPEAGSVLSAPRLGTDSNGKLMIMFGVSTQGTFDTLYLSAGGYIGRMDEDGNFIFLKKICQFHQPFTGSVYNFDEIKMVNNLLFVCGGSYDSLTLDTILLPDTNLYSHVVSVWDTTGSILWAKQSSHSQTSKGAMCIDVNGNVYSMASFAGPFIVFGQDTLFTTNSYGAFLLKYDKLGQLLWYKTISTGGLGCYGAAIDSEGNTYFTGAFVDSLTIENFNLLSNTGVEELFIARFDTNGNCLGVRQAGNSFGNDILESSSGDLYVSGTFRNTATFGNISIPSYGISDIFLANLNAITGLGGGERMIQDQLIIYANPNKGSFRVQVPEQLSDLRGAWLFVYDVQGKEVARFNLDKMNETPQLEINNANAGFYTVRLVKDKKVFTGKMVVE